MIRVTADDKIPFLRGILEPFAEVKYLPGSQIDRNAAMESDALLVRTRTRCSREILEGTPVKFIGTATIGFDHIDTDYCDQNAIKWVNAEGCNASSVGQYITSALLKISAEAGFSPDNKTIGIIGVGNVGSRVCHIARTMGMNVLLNDPPRERREGKKDFVSLEHLLSASDIITIHVPLNMEGDDRTLHLFDENLFSAVKKGSWLINSSRGEVVKTDALKDALSEEILAGAVIDVWEREPEIDTSLMHMAFIATPHIAGYSADGKANGTAMVVSKLCEFFGLPLRNWYPSDIPLPQEPEISIDCSGKTIEEILRKAVFHSYNITEDDIRLRFDPSRFERTRENYPVRREFPNYNVRLRDHNEKAARLLSKLGFKIIL